MTYISAGLNKLYRFSQARNEALNSICSLPQQNIKLCNAKR